MHALPEALAPMAAYQQFIVYVVVPHPTKPNKTNKFPCDFRTGRVADAHDARIWTSAETAIAAAAHYNTQGGPNPYGVGFVFTANDPFWFLDIDGAHDGRDWSQLAKDLCAAFPGAAIEVSTSGRGLHIFGTSGPVPMHKTKNSAYGLEFYHAGRFVALTGTNATGSAATDHSATLPRLIEQFFKPEAGTAEGDVEGWTTDATPEWRGPNDDDILIARMMRSNPASAAFGGGITFADLWTCNVEALARAYPDAGGGGPYDASSADSALAQRLAFWTGKNCERMLRIMQRSALVREKWSREDYLPRTILNVCARQVDVLTDKEPEPVRMPHLPPASGERRALPRPEIVGGSTFLSIEQQLDMFEGCVYVCDANRVLVPGGLLLKADQFRIMFGGYTFPMDKANERTSRDAWEAFTQSQAFRCPRADTSCFKPDRAPGDIVNEGGRTLVNTWWPVEVERAPGDVGPFMTHLHKLLPNERDRQILLAYMAACVQHVGVKFQWAPLLQGVEGNGKSLLSRCVAYAVGRRYVHWPNASKLTNQFNGWMVGKVFYAVEDIYVADGRRDVIEELKPMITGGDGLEIEGKGVDQISADICGNFMFNSNHKDAIAKSRNDRRFAVFYTAQQQAADLMRDGMRGGYMPAIYNWLKNEGGYAIVAELLHTYPIPDDLNPAGTCDRAPLTSSTEEAITASMGSIEQEVMEAIEQQTPGFAGGWISSIALDALLDRLNRARQLPRNKRKDLLASLGYVLHPGLPDGRVNNNVPPDNGKPRLYVRSDSPALHLVGASTIAGAYSSAQLPGMMNMQAAA